MPIEPIEKPEASEHQKQKAARCVVTFRGEGFWVWDPMVMSEHIVSPTHVCDCTGYQSRGFCSHILAVELYQERHKTETAQQAIDELFDF